MFQVCQERKRQPLKGSSVNLCLMNKAMKPETNWMLFQAFLLAHLRGSSAPSALALFSPTDHVLHHQLDAQNEKVWQASVQPLEDASELRDGTAVFLGVRRAVSGAPRLAVAVGAALGAQPRTPPAGAFSAFSHGRAQLYERIPARMARNPPRCVGALGRRGVAAGPVGAVRMAAVRLHGGISSWAGLSVLRLLEREAKSHGRRKSTTSRGAEKTHKGRIAHTGGRGRAKAKLLRDREELSVHLQSPTAFGTGRRNPPLGGAVTADDLTLQHSRRRARYRHGAHGRDGSAVPAGPPPLLKAQRSPASSPAASALPRPFPRHRAAHDALRAEPPGSTDVRRPAPRAPSGRPDRGRTSSRGRRLHRRRRRRVGRRKRRSREEEGRKALPWRRAARAGGAAERGGRCAVGGNARLCARPGGALDAPSRCRSRRSRTAGGSSRRAARVGYAAPNGSVNPAVLWRRLPDESGTAPRAEPTPRCTVGKRGGREGLRSERPRAFPTAGGASVISAVSSFRRCLSAFPIVVNKYRNGIGTNTNP